jgi:hypothetical protein
MNPAGTADRELMALVRRVQALKRQAVREYRPAVEHILRSGNRDAAHIERTLDGMLEFCDHEPMLALYKALCRHHWAIDPEATAWHVRAYRERWDSEEREDWE